MAGFAGSGQLSAEAVAAPASEAPPSLELLLYLAEFEQQDDAADRDLSLLLDAAESAENPPSSESVPEPAATRTDETPLPDQDPDA